MRKWIFRALVVLFALALVNDAGRYLIGTYEIRDVSRNMAFEASKATNESRARNAGWPAARGLAEENGLEVTAYEESEDGVTVGTKLLLSGTYLFGPARAAILGQPLSTPIPITHQTTSRG